MTINSVSQSGYTDSVTASTQNSAQKTSSAAVTPPANKDTAIISESAKDLAALKTGQASKEESTESVSSKLIEAASGSSD